MIRIPDRYTQNTPERHRRKWEHIHLSFMQSVLTRLRSVQRTSSRQPPNARVENVDIFYDELKRKEGDLITKFQLLRELKGIIR